LLDFNIQLKVTKRAFNVIGRHQLLIIFYTIFKTFLKVAQSDICVSVDYFIS